MNMAASSGRARRRTTVMGPPKRADSQCYLGILSKSGVGRPSGVWSVPRDRVTPMCGRYAASANPDELVEEFEVTSSELPERVKIVEDAEGKILLPRFNLAPTDL